MMITELEGKDPDPGDVNINLFDRDRDCRNSLNQHRSKVNASGESNQLLECPLGAALIPVLSWRRRWLPIARIGAVEGPKVFINASQK
jgi:hypothetical protein